MNRFCDFIDRLNTWVGRKAAFLILPLVFVIMYEVLSRYLFNAPTRWSNEISQYLLVAVVMLGGGYCLADNEHVNVDIFYRNFTWRTRAIVEILTFINALFGIDILVYPPETIQKRIALGDSFLKEIMMQGVVLYESVDARMG